MTGFTKFDNQLLEKVVTSGLTKRQLKILLLILRYSAGYQKTYAVLRKSDFTYAGVPQSVITEELRKLFWLGVIRWDPSRDMVWINPHLDQWSVDNVGGPSGKAFAIAARNSLKWQLAICRNGNLRLHTTTSPNKDIKKGQIAPSGVPFVRVLESYFFNVSPLSPAEVSALHDTARTHGLRVIDQAIRAMASENDRSFAMFLKAVDAYSGKPTRHTGISGFRSALGGYLGKFRKPR